MNELYMNTLSLNNFLTEDHKYKHSSWTINNNHIQVTSNETKQIKLLRPEYKVT
jgi:hypothetical protein